MFRFFARSLPAVLLLGLFGCEETPDPIDPQPTPQGIAADIADASETLDMNVAGCGDVFVYAFDDAETRRITISIQGDHAETARTALTTQVTTFDLPHPDVTITAAWGDQLVYELCNDALDPNLAPLIDGEATAISGTVVLTIEPEIVEDAPTQVFAHLELQDVTLEHTDSDAQHTIDAAMVEDVFVGWYPG